MNYESLLYELLDTDERFIVMTAENRAAMRKLSAEVKDRFVDVGIAEQTMIGMAAGLALRGRIPLVHALSSFLTMRAFEFIRTDVGLGNLPVKLVGAAAGFLSEANGPTHQAVEDISLMRGIPNMNIFCPADEEDMLAGIKEVFLSPNPFYVRYNNTKPEVSHKKGFKIGKAEVISEGNDATILTYGILLGQAAEAASILRGQGLSVGVVNLRTLKPIDRDLVIKVCNQSSIVVALEDHFKTGGLFSVIGEIVLEEELNCKVRSISLENRWFKPALLKNVLEYERFTGESIAEEIYRLLENSAKAGRNQFKT